MPVVGDSLITVQEAEEVVSAPTGIVKQLRTPLMIILGALIIIIATLIVLLFLSIRGTKTGWQSIFPFLDSKPINNLQVD